MTTTHFDVAIIGGGPAGSTCGSLIRKYNPDLRVAIIEKAEFPREHVGESLLPPVGGILEEMGAWDAVEAQNFPIKLGATYRWGKSKDLWDFSFLPFDDFVDAPRPGKFEGQRRRTAFHVDRARFDTVLLDSARALGCEIIQPAQVRDVERTGDHIDAVTLENGQRIQANWYVDGSGEAGIIRRAMKVPVEYPAKLKNIAMWDYFDGAEWSVRFGTDATRVAILSIACGWIWYIPIAQDRVSIGFVCPAEFYKTSGKTPAELYEWALAQEPLVTELTRNATPDGDVKTTKDWSFRADRLTGDNWFLAGDACGFADPILAAGLTLCMSGAREVAYALLELFRGEHDPNWLKDRYNEVQRSRIGQHIRFADFWYAGNGIFTDIEEHTSKIAKESGLKLDPKAAFRWLANGGLTTDSLSSAGLAGHNLSIVKHVADKLTGDKNTDWVFTRYNVYKLNLRGAVEKEMPDLAEGRIVKRTCLVREDKMVPLVGHFALALEALSERSEGDEVLAWMVEALKAKGHEGRSLREHMNLGLQALEVLLTDGWAWGQVNRKKPPIKFEIEAKQSGSVIKDVGQRAPQGAGA